MDAAAGRHGRNKAGPQGGASSLERGELLVAHWSENPAPLHRGVALPALGVPPLLADVGASGPATGGAGDRRRGGERSTSAERRVASSQPISAAVRPLLLGDTSPAAGGSVPPPVAVVPPRHLSVLHHLIDAAPQWVEAGPRGRPLSVLHHPNDAAPQGVTAGLSGCRPRVLP